MDTWTFEDLRSWVASIVQKSSLRRSTATPAGRLSCADWIILSLLKHQETIDHKTIFFFLIGILIVRVAAKFLLLFNSCCCWWWLNLLLPLRKLLLTSIKLIKLSLKKKISYDIVRKSRTNFVFKLQMHSQKIFRIFSLLGISSWMENDLKFISFCEGGNPFQRYSASCFPDISSSFFSISFDFAIFAPSNLNLFFYFYIF